MSEQSVERKSEDIEIDLLDIFRRIIAIRKKLYKAAIIGLLIGIIVGLSIPKKYVVNITLSPEMGNDKGNSGLTGLAASFFGGSAGIASLEYQFPAILKDWTKNDFIQEWVRGRAALNIKKSANSQQRHPYEPCYLYESGIRPLEQYPIRGVIWYQGESNAHNWEAHEKLFKLLVNSWRKNWNDACLPFYYVQLSSLNRPSWPWFRDSQRRMLNEISHIGMAVSSDHGDSLDVHPICKKPVGERLARGALNKTYQKNVIPSGPLFRGANVRGGKVFLSFDYGKGMRSSDGKPLQCFEVAEYDGIYYPATAEVVGDQVKVYSKEVPNPRYVRYGWQPFTRANLINREGLPASTFRAEFSMK